MEARRARLVRGHGDDYSPLCRGRRDLDQVRDEREAEDDHGEHSSPDAGAQARQGPAWLRSETRVEPSNPSLTWANTSQPCPSDASLPASAVSRSIAAATAGGIRWRLAASACPLPAAAPIRRSETLDAAWVGSTRSTRHWGQQLRTHTLDAPLVFADLGSQPARQLVRVGNRPLAEPQNRRTWRRWYSNVRPDHA